MGIKLYDFTLKVLNLAIPEFKKDGYGEKDIQEGFDLAKKDSEPACPEKRCERGFCT